MPERGLEPHPANRPADARPHGQQDPGDAPAHRPERAVSHAAPRPLARGQSANKRRRWLDENSPARLPPPRLQITARQLNLAANVARRAAQVLGIAPPQVEVIPPGYEDRARPWASDAGLTGLGFVAPDHPGTVFVRDRRQSDRELARVVAHETRHVWQLRVAGGRSWSEARREEDANTFADRFVRDEFCSRR